jgi:hypothetical protein
MLKHLFGGKNQMAFYECKDEEIPRAIITCDCVSECTELHLSKYVSEFEDEEENNEYYISLQPRSNLKNSLWYRLKIMWRILTTGGLYEDCMTLDEDTVNELREWLNKNNT